MVVWYSYKMQIQFNDISILIFLVFFVVSLIMFLAVIARLQSSVHYEMRFLENTRHDTAPNTSNTSVHSNEDIETGNFEKNAIHNETDIETIETDDSEKNLPHQ